MSEHKPTTQAAAGSRINDRTLRAAVLDHSIFDPKDQNVKHDIIRRIIQFRQGEGYYSSSMVVQDEKKVKMMNAASKHLQLKGMKRAILDGDWQEVERLLSGKTFKNMKPFKYALYTQQFLGLLKAEESQKAFTILQ